MNTKTPSENYRATPYLICRNAAEAVEWYCKSFNAAVNVCLADDSGKVMHAEVLIGRSPIMLADEFPEMGYKCPETLGGSPVSIYLYVDDVDRVFAQAIAHGATEVMAISDQFDGDRRGTLRDPYGHIWLLATKKEEISFDEMKLKFSKMMQESREK